MRVRVIVVGLVILGLLAGTMAVRAVAVRATNPARVKAGPAATTQAPAAVAVTAAARGDFVTRVIASGTVTSIREAKIGSKASGRVAGVFVEEGQRVAAGQPLMRLDTSELEANEAQARADVAAARARLAVLLAGARPEERRQAADSEAQAEWALRLAQQKVERMRALHRQGAVAAQDLDTAEAEFARAQMGYDWARQASKLVASGARSEDIQAARAQLAQAEALHAAARVRVQDSTVVAPFAGTITKRNVEPGETVTAQSSESFRLAQIDDVFVELSVPERSRPSVLAGQHALVQVDGLAAPVAGRVEEIRPAATGVSRMFGVKVRVRNPQGALRPGMFAKGAIVVAVRSGVVQIPERAVVLTANGPIVFVVEPRSAQPGGGTAVRHEVTLGQHDLGRVEVTAGIADGERVVVEGQEGLTDHQAVVVRAGTITSPAQP